MHRCLVLNLLILTQITMWQITSMVRRSQSVDPRGSETYSQATTDQGRYSSAPRERMSMVSSSWQQQQQPVMGTSNMNAQQQQPAMDGSVWQQQQVLVNDSRTPAAPFVLQPPPSARPPVQQGYTSGQQQATGPHGGDGGPQYNQEEQQRLEGPQQHQQHQQQQQQQHGQQQQADINSEYQLRDRGIDEGGQKQQDRVRKRMERRIM